MMAMKKARENMLSSDDDFVWKILFFIFLFFKE